MWYSQSPCLMRMRTHILITTNTTSAPVEVVMLDYYTTTVQFAGIRVPFQFTLRSHSPYWPSSCKESHTLLLHSEFIFLELFNYHHEYNCRWYLVVQSMLLFDLSPQKLDVGRTDDTKISKLEAMLSPSLFLQNW